LSASTRTSLTAEVDVKHCDNFFGIHRYYAEGTTPIPARDQLRMGFKYGGGGLAKGGDCLSPDGPTDNDFSGEVLLGPDRSGEGRSRSPEFSRRALQDRDGAAVKHSRSAAHIGLPATCSATEAICMKATYLALALLLALPAPGGAQT
jgi:hypothetical protein